MSSVGRRRPVGVAVAGFGWMGRVHTQAYARVLHHFPDLTVAPRLVAVADEVPGRAEDAAAQVGFAAATRDWRELAADPAVQAEGALTWRCERARGGSGVLGDLAAHGVDLVWHLLGAVDAVIADTAIFVPERALPTGATAGHARAAGGELGRVENEDYVSSLLRLASGARVVVEASRVAVGEQNNYGFEIHFLRSIAEGTPRGTTLADAVRSAATLDAMARSADTGTWVKVAAP